MHKKLPASDGSYQIKASDNLLKLSQSPAVSLLSNNHQKDLGGCMGFAGAACYLDYRELTMQDYEWFFEKLRQAGIKLIFDIGIASPPELRFFGLFDRIFLPLIREDLNSFEYQRFKKQMRKHGIWTQTSWEEAMLESWQNKWRREQWP